MVRVKIGTDIREYPQGTTWAQVAEEYQSGFEHDILLVQIGGKLQELHKTVRDGSLRFITAEEKPGMSAYQRSATLLMLKALYAVAGAERVEKVIVDFSVGKGFFVEARGAFTVDDGFLEQVKAKMEEYVNRKNSHPKSAVYPRMMRSSCFTIIICMIKSDCSVTAVSPV